MAKVIMIIIVTVKIIIMISRIAGEADQQILITINKKNNNNGDKQNMGEPERPTNGSASLTVKRASLIDCQVFF